MSYTVNNCLYIHAPKTSSDVHDIYYTFVQSGDKERNGSNLREAFCYSKYKRDTRRSRNHVPSLIHYTRPIQKELCTL